MTKKPAGSQNFQVVLIALVAVIIYLLFSLVSRPDSGEEKKLIPTPVIQPTKSVENRNLPENLNFPSTDTKSSELQVPKGLEGLPPDLLKQLQAEHDALPKHLERQLNEKPEPIPEDIKAALTAEPRIVTEDEVNSPR